MTSRRLNNIDVIKGILILIVIMHHVPDVTSDLQLFDSVKWLYDTQFIYTGFFMTTFFVLSGMVTNFKKDFNDFILSGIKGLVFPTITASVIFNLSYLHWNGSSFDIVQELRHFVITGGAWFCAAMFLARIIYWIVFHYIPRIEIRFFVLFLISVFGAVSFVFSVPEPWSIWHAMSLTIFFEIGAILKNKNVSKKWMLISSAFYIFSIYISCILNIEIPRISMNSMYTYSQILPGIALSLFASVSLLYWGGRFSNCRFLCYVGRGSLLIYLSHPFFLRICVMMINQCCDIPYLSIITPIVAFLFATLCCCITIWFFDHKYVRCLLGRF